MSDRHSIPVAIDRAYALWVWLDGRLVDFPAAARPLAGRRVFDAATDLLDALLDATYAPRGDSRRRDALIRANQRLELLRLPLRGARDRRYLSISQHDHAIEQLGELGRMIGGWLRSTRDA
jgi:hypothetical protein